MWKYKLFPIFKDMTRQGIPSEGSVLSEVEVIKIALTKMGELDGPGIKCTSFT